MRRLLVIDDDEAVLAFLGEALSNQHDVVVENSSLEGLARLQRDNFDLVIADVEMPEMRGPELLRAILVKKPHQAVLMMTGFASERLSSEVVRDGARGLLSKPFRIAMLRTAIERIEFEDERDRDAGPF